MAPVLMFVFLTGTAVPGFNEAQTSVERRQGTRVVFKYPSVMVTQWPLVLEAMMVMTKILDTFASRAV
ncbi:MAG: hypothetical protein AAEI08_08820 [Gammaproteobacteria bacterium]